MWKRFKDWWQQQRCPHWQTATQTFLRHDEVMRRCVCLQCGKQIAPPERLPNDVLLDLLEQAKSVPPETVVRI